MIPTDHVNLDPETYEPLEPEETRRHLKERPSFTVLHDDEQVVVLNKSAGISSIRERFIPGISLKEIAEQRFGRLWTVHRIDKETSGVILFARDAESHRILNSQFEQGRATKIYAAALEGVMAEEEIRIDIPIVPDPAHPGRMRPSARGKESLTILRRREVFRGFTYAEAQPLTGRQHQIRVHCRAVGLPLAVDSFYGNRSELLLSSIKRKYKSYDREERPLISRLTLHAERLTIDHPATELSVTFEAPLPRDLRALLSQLRKVAVLR